MSHRLYQRGRTWWVDVRLDDGTRHRESTGTRNETQAAERARDIANRVESGAGAQWTLAQAIDRTAEVRWKGTRGERTAVHNAGEAATYFGAGVPLRDITTDRLDGYVRWLADERGNGDATINRKLAALSAVLRTAQERGQLAALPRLPRRREAQNRTRFLTEDEQAELVRACQGMGRSDVAGLVDWLADTGLRLGEALRLRWADVDRDQQVVHVWETKTDRPRTVPLTQRARRVVEGDRQGTGPWSDLSRSAVRHVWEKAKLRTSMRDDDQVVVHTLRHTCASRLVQRGVALAVVQQWLGHSSVTTTMRYAHLAPDNLRQAVAHLESHQPPTLRRIK